MASPKPIPTIKTSSNSKGSTAKCPEKGCSVVEHITPRSELWTGRRSKDERRAAQLVREHGIQKHSWDPR